METKEMIQTFTEWYKNNKAHLNETVESRATNAGTQPSAFTLDDFQEVVSLIATWTAPCTFHRTKRAPMDDMSVFKDYGYLSDYLADGQTTSYPGQIVSVIGGNDQSKKGVYVLQLVNDVLTPIKIDGSQTSQSQAQTTSGTCGTDCCIWINNPRSVAAEYYVDQKNNPNYWVAASYYCPDLDGVEIEDTATHIVVNGIDIYRQYIPAHTEDAQGNWVDGHWSDWTVYAIQDNSTVTDNNLTIYSVTINDRSGYSFTTEDGDVYKSDDFASSGKKCVIILNCGDKSAMAFREWVND